MKTRYLLLAIFLPVCLWVSGQGSAGLLRNASVELYGASGMFGAAYESRFKAESPFGYRVGIGYFAPGTSCPQIRFEKGNYFVGAPVVVNYLLGKRSSKAEFGLGATLGVEHQEYLTKHGMKKLNDFAYWMNITVGYRYQRPGGLLLRAGFNPTFNFGDRHGIDRGWFSLMPYVGIGWAF